MANDDICLALCCCCYCYVACSQPPSQPSSQSKGSAGYLLIVFLLIFQNLLIFVKIIFSNVIYGAMKAKVTDEVNKIKFIDTDYCEKFVYVCKRWCFVCLCVQCVLRICWSALIAFEYFSEVELGASAWKAEKRNWKGKERWQVE